MMAKAEVKLKAELFQYPRLAYEKAKAAIDSVENAVAELRFALTAYQAACFWDMNSGGRIPNFAKFAHVLVVFDEINSKTDELVDCFSDVDADPDDEIPF